MSLVGYGVPPEAPSHPVLLGGAQIRLDSGYGTSSRPSRSSARPSFAAAWSLSQRGDGVSGSVLVTFHGPDETEDNTISVDIQQDGWFILEVQPFMDKFRSEKLSLHYPGNAPFAACDPDQDTYELV